MKRKLVVRTLVLLALLLATACAALATAALTLNRRQQCQLGHAQARFLGRQLGDRPAQGQLTAIHELFARFLQEQALVRYVFLETDGRASAPTCAGGVPTDQLALCIGATGADTERQLADADGHVFYDIATRLGPGPNYVHLGLERGRIDQTALTPLLWIAGLGLLFFLGLSYPAVLIAGAIARDVNELTQQLGERVAGRTREVDQANEALRESEGRYRLLYGAITDPLVIHELEADGTLGRFLEVNEAAQQLFGHTRNELLGMTPRDLLAGDETRDQRLVRAKLRSGGSANFEQVLRTKDGRQIPVEIHAQPFAWCGRYAIMSVVRDATERKSLEAQLLRTQRLESVGRLAGGIAHDLNNILASIFIATPLLRESLHDPDDVELLDTIESSAQRGADIIKQLLTFSRGLPGQRVPLPLTPLVREMLKIIAETFPKNIAAQFVAPPDLPLVSGNTTQLHQVLMNLCVNARDAMPLGGTLTIALAPVELDESFVQLHPGTRPGAFILLSVRDNGTGIPAPELDKLFDPFFTTKQPGEGTGLGLSTTLGIVRGHHGFILVASTPGQGAEFKVYLPICPLPAAPAVAAPPAPAPASPPGQGELVLVVDDEANVRQMTCHILERSGYRVFAAADGVAALAAYAQHAGDIRAILTDLMMPLMDGPALIRALRGQKTSAKIIAMSGYTAQPELLRELDIAPHAFLAKPFGAAVLLQTLRQMLAP